MKKLLAVVLAAATVASLGVTSFAADATYSYQTDDSEVIAYFDSSASVPATGTDNVVQPDNTLYFLLPVFNVAYSATPGAPTWDTGTVKCQATLGSGTLNASTTPADYANKDLYKVKFDKGDVNAKMIKSISISDKSITGNTTRGPWLKVELKDDWTDNEYKIAPSVTITSKKDIKESTNTTVMIPAGTKFELKLDKYYINNTTETADQDYAAGTGGVMLKPQKNEDNEIIWHDENRDLARLTFVGDSNVNKVFPKLSTKWENEDYAELFADQNAFYFDFVANVAGKTTISSTSRATLEIYNPYYDKDEDTLLVDPADVVIYEVAEDGTFEDVTASFTAGENDDGDSVFVTKTRELGSYIFAEKTAGVVEEVVEAPAKDVPNTGR